MAICTTYVIRNTETNKTVISMQSLVFADKGTLFVSLVFAKLFQILKSIQSNTAHLDINLILATLE